MKISMFLFIIFCGIVTNADAQFFLVDTDEVHFNVVFPSYPTKFTTDIDYKNGTTQMVIFSVMDSSFILMAAETEYPMDYFTKANRKAFMEASCSSFFEDLKGSIQTIKKIKHKGIEVAGVNKDYTIRLQTFIYKNIAFQFVSMQKTNSATTNFEKKFFKSIILN